jgi:polyisoprenoid-binding protein YceI
MRKFALLFLGLLALPSLATAEAPTPYAQMPSGVYRIDPAHASVTWRVSHLGLSNYTARFAKIDASLDFDAKDPTQSKLTASVDPLSVRTDFPAPDKKDFDAVLATGETWFNGGKFPTISFVSTSIERVGPDKGIVSGNLTMLGVTKPATMEVKFNGAYAEKPFSAPVAAALGFSGTMTIKRSDWGFNTYVPMIGDEVAIQIEAEFEQVVSKTN